MIQLCVLLLMAWWQQQRYHSRLTSLIPMVNKLGYKCLLQPCEYWIFRKPSQSKRICQILKLLLKKIKIWQSSFQMFKRVVHQQKENKKAAVSQTVLLKPEHFCRNSVRSGLGFLPTSYIPKGITGQCFTACWQRVFLSSAWSRRALEGCLLCAGPGWGAGRGCKCCGAVW